MFFFLILLDLEGSGSGSLTNGSGSGRPKKHMAPTDSVPDPQHCLKQARWIKENIYLPRPRLRYRSRRRSFSVLITTVDHIGIIILENGKIKGPTAIITHTVSLIETDDTVTGQNICMAILHLAEYRCRTGTYYVVLLLKHNTWSKSAGLLNDIKFSIPNSQ